MVAPNKTFCKADFAHFTLAQFWNNFSIRPKFKNEKKWLIFMKKTLKGVIVQSYAFFMYQWNLTFEDWKITCAPLQMRARRAFPMQCNIENLAIVLLFLVKYVSKMFFTCWHVWSFWARTLSSLMSKYVFIDTWLLFECQHNTIFYWKE